MFIKKFAQALVATALLLPAFAQANEGASLPPAGNDIRNRRRCSAAPATS